VRTNRDVIQRALKLAGVKKDDLLYDLGCGNGDVLIEASKLGAECVGYEISPYYYILSKLRTWRFKNIKVKYQNINDVILSEADIVYVYLLPEFLEKLTPKFKKELKPSARLISIGFPIKDLESSQKIIFKNRVIFIYL